VPNLVPNYCDKGQANKQASSKQQQANNRAKTDKQQAGKQATADKIISTSDHAGALCYVLITMGRKKGATQRHGRMI
jgi:hypothetical protein